MNDIRLAGSYGHTDGVFHSQLVGSAVCDHHGAIHAQEQSAAILAEIQPLAHDIKGRPGQQSAEHSQRTGLDLGAEHLEQHARRSLRCL